MTAYKHHLVLSLVLGVAFFTSENAVAQSETVLASTDMQVVDLPTVLRLAGADNLDIKIVKEALIQAEAASDAATLRFFPWLSGGIGYTKHDGAAQDFSGNVLNVDKELHSRTGAVTAQVNLGEAVFQKLAARQVSKAASFGVNAQENDTLFAAAAAYFDLVDAVAKEEIARRALAVSGDYQGQLKRAADIGLTNKSDELRVSVQTQRYEIGLRQALAAVRTSSARLAQILHIDPAFVLMPADKIPPEVALMPLDAEIESLVEEALASRPEVKGSIASLDAAEWGKREAKYAPLVPSVGAQALYGKVRGGRNGNIGPTGNSQDYALMLNWRVGPGGLFDFSRINMADSKFRQSKLIDAKLRDDITRQVVEAYESASAALEQAALAQENVELADRNLALSRQRKEFGIAAVLEVIQATKDLSQAQNDYIQARTQYAKAQYALVRAIGRRGL